MKFAHFFIDRPIFATVLSVAIVLVGAISYYTLPVSQYPEIALPTVVVTTTYPGATAETVAETVATPIEQEVNGVERMLYMESQSTPDGTMSLTITFELGTDVDQAQVLVQNRVDRALPRLPEEVRRGGVVTQKSSPEMLMVVHLISPDRSRDQVYISNYAYLQIRDALSRINGVGELRVFGGSEYSMRVWLDPEHLASLDLTAGDVVAALREQNVQVAAGKIGQTPLPEPTDFQLTISSQGRLRTAEEFAQIVIKRGAEGRLTRLSDVARIELGAQDYSVNSYLDGNNAVALLVFARPGTNGVDTAHEVEKTVKELSKNFPDGLEYRIAYNPTRFVEESIEEVFRTLIEATILVVLTVFIFLQRWQATLIPVVAIPISLIGTFAIMSGLGFSLNSLSLFGLVLAIGIVVDDAIVVVENVERLIHEGMSPREATRTAMTEVGSALIASALVLVAVFVPTAFMAGISGQFYRQFAVTIAVATVISAFVSLTLTPAMCALLLQPSDAKPGLFTRGMDLLFGWFFRPFNRVFDFGSNLYAGTVRRFVRMGLVMLIIYGGLLVATRYSFDLVPTGFIPEQDQGYLIVTIQLPDSASLTRTDEIVRRVSEIALDIDGINNAVAFAGFSGATRTNATNVAACFTALEDAGTRAERGREINVLQQELQAKLSQIQEADIRVLAPPPVRGIGNAGGVKLYVQDRGGAGYQALGDTTNAFVGAAMQEAGPATGIAAAFSFYRADTPQLYADIDRTRAQQLDVPMQNVFDTLQVYLGSLYVNDFNYLGRTYRVTAQADAEYRDELSDVLRLRTRSASGAIVPLGTILTMKERIGPDRIVRYNLFPSADVNGVTLPGTSTGQSIAAFERIAATTLPQGFDYEWTDLAYQEKAAGNTALLIFPLCVVFVFLTLAAQYESWVLPLAIILIVPLCLLFAIGGVWFRGMDNNILTQIGFVVLIALACKNAILIVEFAKALEDQGKTRFEAAVEACRLRLRAILMTAFSFVLGVIPLLIATGAGFEMRRALGTAVFSGMLGVTIMGLFLTPVFYVLLRGVFGRKKAERTA
ncbi:efflux RND transporter permease subunit [Botrimarina mediterranea]|uniref:Efflux pump membrane transporter BepE n=1 Tax=Botrimarina mediterranea TaxID=2528022 RepID=A0A518K4V1_9BACT|nr:multidrug efflux RND transporter permease subunit [Botrimarina mediterranea]QDV72824.1 Efflux pump membrane transporter BepE [Botrimarina mediterranea]